MFVTYTVNVHVIHWRQGSSSKESFSDSALILTRRACPPAAMGPLPDGSYNRSMVRYVSELNEYRPTRTVNAYQEEEQFHSLRNSMEKTGLSEHSFRSIYTLTKTYKMV